MPLLPIIGKLAVKYLVPLLIQKAAELGISSAVKGWKKVRKKKDPSGN